MILDKANLISISFLILFFISAGISTLYSQYALTSFYYYIWLTKLVVVFLIGKIVFSDPKIVKKTLEILTVLALVNSVLIIGQYLTKGPLGIAFEDTFNQYGKYSEQKLFRPGGITNDPNISATLTTALLPPVLINTLTVSGGMVIANWTILLILLLGLIFTASRAAWIIAIIISVLIIFYLRKKNKIFIPELIKKYWRVGLVILLIATAPVIINRLSTFQQAFTWQGSGTYRFRQIPIALRMMQENSFGIGLGMFSHPIISYNLSERFQLPSDLPHNLIVQIGGETGIVGLFFFSLFLYFLIRSKVVKLKKDGTLLSISMFTAFIAILLLMMAYPWFMHPRISWLFWILAAF
jgi:O-antigen ligase